MKKAVIIIIIILGLVAMGFGIYFAWKKTREILTPPITSDKQQATNDKQILALAEKKIKILSDKPIFDYWLSYSTSSATPEIFYINQEGQILKVKEGEDEIIVQYPIENFQSIKVGSDGKQILVKFGGLLSPFFSIFNAETKIWQPLSNDIAMVAADFSPDAKKLVYLDKSGNLMLKDLVNTKAKDTKVILINQKDFDLEWISAEKIILTPKPSALYLASAWVVDIKNKTINLLAEAEGLMINWSATGKLGLEFLSKSKGREGSLNMIDEQGKIKANFDEKFLTLPSKCLLSEPKLYCAIPREIPPKTVLPDDYLKKEFYSRDFIYQIDVNQNSLTEIYAKAEPIIDAVRLNLLDNKLLFINRYDNKLYQLEM